MARPLPMHGEMPEPVVRPRLALSAKGFRPFFLLAALFAIAIVPLWLLVLSGLVRPTTYLDAASWHAHEMVFGFAVAVISGFLLTAVGNWTKRETVIGAPLLALAALWLLGRLAMVFAGSLPRGLPAACDLAFVPLVVTALARPLVATKNRRNFVMLAILLALFAANVVVHFDALGIVAAGSARRASSVAVDIVVLVILVIAGRVFPMFTRNATGVEAIRSIPALDVLTVVMMAVLTLVDVFATPSLLAPALAAVVGVLAAARAVHWGSVHSVRHPLLWILHAGYAWLVLGLLLRGAAAFASIPSSAATHALTVGAIGGLTLGMMARVALGHTGRALVVPPSIAWAFGAINAAALVRVLVPLFAPSSYFMGLVAAGGLWTIAFAIFVVVYAPILTSPRVDGKAG